MPATANRKSALVHALSACIVEPHKAPSRRFLQGLSTDELQYIAEFLGACILESGGRCYSNRTQLAEAIKQFDRSRSPESVNGRGRNSVQDHEHKMILLLEYLCRSGLTRFSIGVGAGG